MNWVVLVGLSWLAVVLPVAYLIGRALRRADRRDAVGSAAPACGPAAAAPPVRDAPREDGDETAPGARAAHRDGDEAGRPGNAGATEADSGSGRARSGVAPTGTHPGT